MCAPLILKCSCMSRLSCINLFIVDYRGFLQIIGIGLVKKFWYQSCDIESVLKLIVHYLDERVNNSGLPDEPKWEKYLCRTRISILRNAVHCCGKSPVTIRKVIKRSGRRQFWDKSQIVKSNNLCAYCMYARAAGILNLIDDIILST